MTLTPRGFLGPLFPAILALCLLCAACGGGSRSSPSPSRSPSPAGTPTPAPVISPTPAAAGASGYKLVYRQSGAKADIIWRVLPANPSAPERLATIGHRDGVSVVPALSPDQRLLAYLSLPDSAQDTISSQAEAYVIDLKTQKTSLIAGGIDYQFRPLWSPDGQLLFLRRYAGAERLSSDVSIIYTRVNREPLPDEPTPAPSPSPTPLAPGATPGPSPAAEDPIKTVLQAKYSQVQSFIPIGFAADDRSLDFVQVNGGTSSTTEVGQVSPATAASVDAARAQWDAEVKAILASVPTPDPNATPLPPDVTPTPAPVIPPLPPSPTPTAKLVTTLTDQPVQDYRLSADKTKVCFVAGGLAETGDLLNQAFYADLGAGAVQPVPDAGLPPGDRLSPVWHPGDSSRLAVGFLPQGAMPGGVALVNLAGGPPQFLPLPQRGFDVPIAWSPDASFLAVTNYTGLGLANPGEAELDLLAPTGQRVVVATGADSSTAEAVIGWFQ